MMIRHSKQIHIASCRNLSSAGARIFWLILSLWLINPFVHAVEGLRFSAPSGDQPCQRNVNGVSIIPNGRLLTPLGTTIVVPPYPFGLGLSPNGAVLVSCNSGDGGPMGISIIADLQNNHPYVRQIPPGVKSDPDILKAVFMGVVIGPDNRTVYISGGDVGDIFVFDLVTGRATGRIDLDGESGGRQYMDSYVGEMVMTRDGTTIYIVDQANFRLARVDTQTGQVTESIPTGRYPFGVCLSPDEKTVYVANAGMFEYSVVKGIDLQDSSTWLDFPPFAYGTQEMEEGVTIGNIRVPGLGKINTPESFSVWAVDVSQPGSSQVTAKIKTGVLVGEVAEGIPAVGGSSPNSLAATETRVYVTNGNNDSITVIDAKSFEVVSHIPLRLCDELKHLRGHIPFGLTLSPDGHRLYVAEAGINAVAVIDTETETLIGRIPTAWFPTKVRISPDGKTLYVANGKGFGAGPNGGKDFQLGPGGTGVGELMKGVIQIIPIPSEDELKKGLQRVVENTVKIESVSVDPAAPDRNPVPPFPGAYESPIKHVVYITKENRTFDQVYGEFPGANGDPTLADLGRDVTVTNADLGQRHEKVNVMPNHQRLAEQFAMYDNFYCDSDHSNDGHRWMVGTFPNTWVETGTKSGARTGKMNSPAPGRRLMTSSSGAIYPEDYNEAGSIWENMHRNGIHFFNFGLGFEFAFHTQTQEWKYTGIRLAVNFPMPGPLFDRTSRRFATYNTSVPDQFRVDMFIEEYNKRWASGQEPFPQVITMMLPNDHGAGPRPAAGYPFRESYMADNDLALGRVIEFLTHTPYWNDMAIFVTEDDAQGGLDHVDHHRSILLVISPYAKRGFISNRHTSFGSIIKTQEQILGIPYLNQYDAAASDLSDCFYSIPDYTPYQAVPVDVRIFDPQKALDPYDKEFDWKAAMLDSPPLDGREFTREEREWVRRKLFGETD